MLPVWGFWKRWEAYGKRWEAYGKHEGGVGKRFFIMFNWWSDMSVKTIQSLESSYKNRAKFAGCLHEEDIKIWEVSCCFPFFYFLIPKCLNLMFENI